MSVHIINLPIMMQVIEELSQDARDGILNSSGMPVSIATDW